MKKLLLLLSIAATLCAQSPPSPDVSALGWQAVINSILSRNPLAVTPMSAQLAAIKPAPSGASPVSPCSVPLLSAQIPSDVNFTMRVVAPPADKVDHMQVAVPAPACPESPR